MIWLSATTGRGPSECEVALTGIIALIKNDAKISGLKFDVLETVDTAHGYESVLIAIDGDGAGLFGQSWTGTVEWICKSEIRPEHKRKRWFVGVSMMSAPDEVSDAVRDTDLVWETMKASGPGGQHVQKTDSAVRLTHKPTGIVVTAQEERSQYRNKSLALAKLRDRIANQKTTAAATASKERWSTHNTLERGNPVRTFVGPNFKEQK